MSTPTDTKQWFIKTVPHGMPKESDFEVKSVPIPELKDGQILVKKVYISVDPYLRGRISSSKPGDTIVSGQVGEVVSSKNKDYKTGDKVLQGAPWSEYTVSDCKSGPQGEFRRITVPESVAPISTAIGVLGMPGMTAYFGLKDNLQIKKGDTLVVSGAAGAVGSLVAQLGKVYGAHVIGIAGGAEKCKHLQEDLGIDAVIDYKAHNSVASIQAELKKAAPNGVDKYFDNTGGNETHALWDLYNKYARVAICGQIAHYNATEAPKVDNFLMKLIYKHVTVEGFIYADYAMQEGRAEEFFKEVSGLIKDGKVKFREHEVQGFDQVPAAFISLFHGANTGKIVVKV